jgi:hypothetical protein
MVRFTGAVDDVAPFLRAARLGIVAEDIGGGFKLKTLDYVFNRLPIVALRGSVAGLPLRPGVDYLDLPTLDGMAAGILSVIDDYKRLNSLHDGAMEQSLGQFQWEDRGRRLALALAPDRAPEAALADLDD